MQCNGRLDLTQESGSLLRFPRAGVGEGLVVADEAALPLDNDEQGADHVHCMRRIAPMVIAIILGLAGCRNPTTARDVTRDKAFQVGYVPGDLYQLKAEQSLFDRRSDDGKTSLVYADPRDDLYVSKVKAGTCMIAAPGRFTNGTVGILPAGTLLEISRLRYETYVSLSDVERYVVAFARVRGPLHAGTEVALTYVSGLVDVADATLATRAQSPNPGLLEAAPQ